MIKVKNKFVCELNSMESFYGLWPLDVYITFIFFNFNKERHQNILLNLSELTRFVTECLVEAVTRERLDFSNFEITSQDIYIGAVPSNTKETKKFLLFKHGNKTIFVSETRFINDDGSKVDSLKMKDISKESLLSLVLSVHYLSTNLIAEMIQQCNSAKKVSLVGKDTDDGSSEEEIDSKMENEEVDLNDYESIH